MTPAVPGRKQGQYYIFLPESLREHGCDCENVYCPGLPVNKSDALSVSCPQPRGEMRKKCASLLSQP